MQYCAIRRRQTQGDLVWDYPDTLKDHHVKQAEQQFQADYMREFGIAAPPPPLEGSDPSIDGPTPLAEGLAPSTESASKKKNAGGAALKKNAALEPTATPGRTKRGTYRSKSVRLQEEEAERHAMEEEVEKLSREKEIERLKGVKRDAQVEVQVGQTKKKYQRKNSGVAADNTKEACKLSESFKPAIMTWYLLNK